MATEEKDGVPSRPKRKLVSPDVYGQLKDMILSFQLAPGCRVTETELATYFHVSRTPVREALRRLETEGYLKVRPKQGCFIREINIDELAKYYTVRVALELLAVESAATNMPTRALEKLAAEWDPAQLEANPSPPRLDEKDETFHIKLAEGGGNHILADYIRDINNHIRIIRRLDLTDYNRIGRTYAEHFEILQHLLRRDATKAKNTMRRHVARSEDFAKALTLTELARRKAFAKRFRFSDS